MRYITTIIIFCVAFLSTSVAYAAGEIPIDLAKPIFDAILSGHYIWAASAGLVLSVAVVRKHGGAIWAPLGSGKAALITAVLASLFGAFLNGITAGEPFDWAVLKAALLVTATGVSFVTMVKAFAPAWAQPFIDMIFGSDKLKRAKEAGDKAVAENPSEGPYIDFTNVK